MNRNDLIRTAADTAAQMATALGLTPDETEQAKQDAAELVGRLEGEREGGAV